MEQRDPISQLFERAKSNNVSMAEICRRAGVDPTTPSRWRRGLNGATIDKVNRLNASLDAILADRAPQTAAA